MEEEIYNASWFVLVRAGLNAQLESRGCAPGPAVPRVLRGRKISWRPRLWPRGRPSPKRPLAGPAALPRKPPRLPIMRHCLPVDPPFPRLCPGFKSFLAAQRPQERRSPPHEGYSSAQNPYKRRSHYQKNRPGCRFPVTPEASSTYLTRCAPRNRSACR